MTKVAVVLLTHFFSDHMMQLFTRLRAEAPEGFEVFVNIHCGGKPLDLPKGAEAIRDRIHLCNNEAILALPYPEKVRAEGYDGQGWKMPGNEDTNILCFYQSHPGFDQYWGVEYDVHFEGKWSFLFGHFAASQADLLATTFYNAAETPWKFLIPPIRTPDGKDADLNEVVRGFYPIFRVSNRFLAAVDAAYREGWTGHYEMTWGAIAKARGLGIEDIGGDGAYVKPHNKNAFYFNSLRTYTLSPGTFVFRPNFARPHKRENTLWHPMKPPGIYNWHVLKAEANFLKGLFYKAKPYVWQGVIFAWFTFVRRTPRNPS